MLCAFLTKLDASFDFNGLHGITSQKTELSKMFETFIYTLYRNNFRYLRHEVHIVKDAKIYYEKKKVVKNPVQHFSSLQTNVIAENPY
jgi:hypothetical protein